MCQRDVSSTAAFGSLQIGHPHVLNGCLHLDFEVLQRSKLVEIRKTQYETKDNPQLNVFTSLADSGSSSQATAVHEIEPPSSWDVGGRRVHQTAVVGSQKRLKRGFAYSKVTRQQHKQGRIGESLLLPGRFSYHGHEERTHGRKNTIFRANGDWLSRGFFATSKLTYVLEKTEGSKLQLRERS